MKARDPRWFPGECAVAEAFQRLGLGETWRGHVDIGGAMNRIFRFRGRDGGDYVLRMRPRWITRRRLEFEHQVAAVGHAAGIPLPAPAQIMPSGRWFRVQGTLCDVYPFVQGRSGQPEAQDVFLAGELLARFHEIGDRLNDVPYEPPRTPNQATASDLSPRMQEFLGRTDDIDVGSISREAVEFLKRRWEILLDEYPEDRPGLLCTLRHGDFHIWNLLYSQAEPARITALLDIDLVAPGPRIYDLSYAIYFLRHALILWRREKVDDFEAWRHLYRRFLQGYAQTCAATVAPEELEVVLPQIECVALNLMLHRIQTEPVRAFDEYRTLCRWLDRWGGTLLRVMNDELTR